MDLILDHALWKGGQFGVRSIMNIFHKLDIYIIQGQIYEQRPRAPWLGKGLLPAFSTAPLKPRVTGLQRESSLPAVPAVGVGVSQPHLPLPMSSSPADLEAAVSPWLPVELQAWEVCGRRGMPELWGMQGPAQGKGEESRREGRRDSHLSTPVSDGDRESPAPGCIVGVRAGPS